MQSLIQIVWVGAEIAIFLYRICIELFLIFQREAKGPLPRLARTNVGRDPLTTQWRLGYQLPEEA